MEVLRVTVSDMGWAVGFIDHRWVGYGVPAICDMPDCGEKIDRGLAYICGDDPGGGAHGCGLFFHAELQSVAFDPETNELVENNNPRWKVEGFDPEILEWANVCPRCANGEPPYDPTPDTDEWMYHMLKDPSWDRWRSENLVEVERIKQALAKSAS